MKQFVKILLCSLLFVFTSNYVSAQKFNADGSMKIEGVSKSKKYGYSSKPKLAIQVGSIENEYAYLMSLRGPNGEPLQYQRAGSCCKFKAKNDPFGVGFIDIWKVSYEGLEEPITIYLNGYDYSTPMSPKGFSFYNAE